MGIKILKADIFRRKDQFTQVSVLMENLNENKKKYNANCISEWRQEDTNTKIVKFIRKESEPHLLVNETTIVSKIRELKNVDYYSARDCIQNKILIFGGIDPNLGSSYELEASGKDVISYNYKMNNWEIYSHMPGSKHHHSAVICNGNIYIIGGSKPSLNTSKPAISKSVWSFDYHNLEWSSETNLPFGRRDFGVVSTKHGFYVIGGENNLNFALSSMLYYDIKSRKWIKKPSLKLARSGLSCVIIGQQIWVAGGILSTQNKNVFTDSVESYDFKTEQWTEIGVLRKPRCLAKMVLINNTHLYIVGGITSLNNSDNHYTSLSSIDKFYFNEKKWKKVANMSTPRHGHDVISINNKMFILGGVTISNILASTLDSVECFSCGENKWVQGIRKLPTPLSGFSAIAVPCI